MDEAIMKAIRIALEEFGIDWILKKRGTKFIDLLNEIELALSKVIIYG